MSLQRKFITVIAVVVFIFSIVVSAYTLTKTSSEIRAQAQAEKKSLSEQVINMLKITDSIMMARVKSSMKLLIERGTASGAPVLASPVNVNGVNANNLIINDQAQANEFQLVDQLTAIMGGTATLFSRNNSEYVRISTNVKKQGRRAIGTKLAAQGKAIKEINSNRAYYGQVDILGMPFITGYEPMRSADGTIVGIWYVGYSADLKVLESLIDESRILSDGFVALRDSKGNIRAHSGIYSNTEIAEFIATSDDNWEISIAPFDTWGYDVVLGISNSEVSAKIQGAIISILVQVFLAGGILLLAILFLVRSMVGKPLNQYIEAIDDIAGGNSDLTRRFDERGRDEFSQMARGFNKLLERIQSTIREVSDNANHLLTVSNKLQQAANDSLSTVTKMRTQTEDVSIDVQKLSDNSQDVATNTKSADTAAADADTQTRHSVEVLNSTIEDIEKQASDVDSTVRVINELAIASEEISGVLDVIRNIAEQTNLLALNAAIEAARAGEQGRGFAVVADEVRSLASRTQSSTEEIRIMIDKLQDGSRKASEAMEGNKDTAFNTVSTTKTAGEALQKALDSVAKISALNRDNSSMTQAQHLVLQSVSNSVSQISAVGNENQQHANAIGECCKQLAILANQMSEQLGTYRI